MPCAHERFKPCAWLDCQLIQRHMIRAEGQSAPKLRLPLAGGLRGPCVNQVDVDAPEMMLCDRQGVKALGNRMRAPQKRQRGIIQ